MLQLPLCE